MTFRTVALGALALIGAVTMGCSGSDGAGGGSPSPSASTEAGPPPPPAALEDSGPADGGPGVDGGGDAPTTEGGPDAGTDAYPAFKPDIGTLVNHGGTLLAAPEIVTITWATDPNTAQLQKFGDEIGASAYWRGAVGEYGVGPATSGAANHVVEQTPSPNPWDDTQIDSWVIAQAGDTAASKWPSPGPQTIYVVYTPPNVKVTSGGVDACQSYSGYHTEVTVGSNPHVLYALVVGECNGSATVLDADTETAAHEIGEASTDPHVYSDLGLVEFDHPHWAWELFQQRQDEDGDACEFYDESYYTEGSDLPFAVQRMWSNQSARAGHNPCVPAPKTPYYNVTPLVQQPIVVHVGSSTKDFATTGYRIPVGQSQTFEVGFYSDGPTEAWTFQAVEGDGFSSPSSPVLDIQTDRPTGKNGDMGHVTVKANAAPAKGTAVLMTLVSTRAMTSHYMPILIGVY